MMESTANIILSECIKLYRPNFNSQQVEYIPQFQILLNCGEYKR